MFKSLRLVFVVFDRKCLSARSDGKGISRPGKLFTCCGGRNAVHCFFLLFFGWLFCYHTRNDVHCKIF